jgi:hypothetical protein
LVILAILLFLSLILHRYSLPYSSIIIEITIPKGQDADKSFRTGPNAYTDVRKVCHESIISRSTFGGRELKFLFLTLKYSNLIAFLHFMMVIFLPTTARQIEHHGSLLSIVLG